MSKPKEYTDYSKMIDDIRAHTYKTGHAIRCEDLPQQLKIGFIDETDSGKHFIMSLSALKTWQSKNPKPDFDLSAEGRQALVNIINAYHRGD